MGIGIRPAVNEVKVKNTEEEIQMIIRLPKSVLSCGAVGGIELTTRRDESRELHAP